MCIYIHVIIFWKFLRVYYIYHIWASLVAQTLKKSACEAGDLGSVPGQEDPLEKEMAIHSSIIAWKIPWTEEPDRLQSMGSDTTE